MREPTPKTVMTKNRTIALAALLGTAAPADTMLAQTVVLSEICADAGAGWIELHNRTGLPVDLTGWSIYQATATAGQPQTYWWAFPANTVLAGGGFLRVHWLQSGPAAPVPGELHTGTTIHHFLFGLGAEPLRGDRGALALLRTQLNAQMNSATSFVDFVCWGGAGLSREAIAVQAGLWQSGTATSAIPTGHSLARHLPAIGTMPRRVDEWFVDDTPTPMQPNSGAAAVQAVGTPCTVFGARLLGPPAMTATSTPVLGNQAFGLTIEHTTGVLFETILLAFSTGTAPPGQPALLPPALTGQPCGEYLDAANVFAILLAPATSGRTRLPLSLAGLPASLGNMRFSLQAIVLDALPYSYPPYQGATNGLTIRLGN